MTLSRGGARIHACFQNQHEMAWQATGAFREALLRPASTRVLPLCSFVGTPPQILLGRERSGCCGLSRVRGECGEGDPPSAEAGQAEPRGRGTRRGRSTALAGAGAPRGGAGLCQGSPRGAAAGTGDAPTPAGRRGVPPLQGARGAPLHRRSVPLRGQMTCLGPGTIPGVREHWQWLRETTTTTDQCRR